MATHYDCGCHGEKHIVCDPRWASIKKKPKR